VVRVNRLVNCEQCGRDTRNRCGVCRKCLAGVSKHTQLDSEAEEVFLVSGNFEHLRSDCEITRKDEINALVADALDGLING
jgi:hypothetical protein